MAGVNSGLLARMSMEPADYPAAELRRFDPGQKRDPDGKWGDGVPGPGMPDGFNSVSMAEGSFGELHLGVDDAGDVQFAFREGDQDRAVDLAGADVERLRRVLNTLVLDRGDAIADADVPDDEVYADDEFGDGAHRVELYGSGIIGIVFGGGDPDDDDPYTLLLDPPYDDDGEESDDVEQVLDALDDVLAELDATAGDRSRGPGSLAEVRRYNAGQPRDPGGEGGGQWVSGGAAGGLKDALKIAGKIGLGPDEKLVGSSKVDADRGGIRMALTERGGERRLRLGAGSEDYGKRNPDEGIAAWDGNPPREPLSKEEVDRLRAESNALEVEWDDAGPDRQDEIDNQLATIRERLIADAQGFNGTAEIDEFGMRRLVDRIRPAMAEAAEQDKAENKAWDEIDALEAAGNPDPERMAQLRRIVDRELIVFEQGIVPGSRWGDVHWSVELDDPSVGPELRIGVQPKGAPDDWGDDKDWQGTFGAAETRKILRQFETYLNAGDTSRSNTPREASLFTRAFQPEDHPRAPAGTDTGGQFAKAGAAAKKSAAAVVNANRPRKGGKRPVRKTDDGTLSYDPGANHGTGYGSANGDDRVHALQQALNRLGIKDSSGKPLKDDGKLGPKTTSAVKALQTRLGVKADGKVTPALLAQIKSMKSLPTQKRSGVMDFCVRSFGFEFEARSRNTDGRTLEGYAAVFNTPTRIAAIGGDFDEVITPGAFTRSIRSRMPVLQFEHGRDPRVGAVPIGAIEDLSEDSRGLHVRATLFDNPVVEPVRQAIAGRAIKGMSFRFNVVDNGDAWQRRSGDVDLRTVGDADVHELGPVVFPAYDATTVSVRSLLAQLGPEEHLTLLRELAHDLRSIDHPGVGPSARSSGGTGVDQDRSREKPRLSIRQRLDEGALQARGIIK